MDPPQDEVVSPGENHDNLEDNPFLPDLFANTDGGFSYMITTRHGEWVRQRGNVKRDKRKVVKCTEHFQLDNPLSDKEEKPEADHTRDAATSPFPEPTSKPRRRRRRQHQQAVSTDPLTEALAEFGGNEAIQEEGDGLQPVTSNTQVLAGFTRPAVRYLTTIYSCFCITLIFAVTGAVSAYSSDLDEQEKVYGQVGNLVLLMVMYSLPPSNRFLLVRTVVLAAFAYLEGTGMPETLDITEGMMHDRKTFTSIVAGSAVIFGGSTLAALCSAPKDDDNDNNRGLPVALIIRLLSYVVLALLSVTLVESSGGVGEWLFSASPYLSLAISGSFVAVDTQLLAAKAASIADEGQTSADPIKDSIMVFLDAVDVFRKMSIVCKRRHYAAFPVLPVPSASPRTWLSLGM